MASMVVGCGGGRALNGSTTGGGLGLAGCAVDVRGAVAAAGVQMHVRAGRAFNAVRVRVERMRFHRNGMVQIGLRHGFADVVACRIAMTGAGMLDAARERKRARERRTVSSKTDKKVMCFCQRLPTAPSSQIGSGGIGPRVAKLLGCDRRRADRAWDLDALHVGRRGGGIEGHLLGLSECTRERRHENKQLLCHHGVGIAMILCAEAK